MARRKYPCTKCDRLMELNPRCGSSPKDLVCYNCRRAAWQRVCEGCGESFVNKKPKRFCSHACWAKNRLAGHCTDCGTSDDVTGTYIPLCPACRKVRKAARQRRWVVAHPAQVNEHDVAKHRRRQVLKAGLPSEPYTLTEIAERDGYVCQWSRCGLPVDMTLSGLHPYGPTIDHRVPISRGGPDVRVPGQRCEPFCVGVGSGGRSAVRRRHEWLPADLGQHLEEQPVRDRRVLGQAVHDDGPTRVRPIREVALGCVIPA